MKESDRYLKWVERSDEDQMELGQRPDLITGIHGDDPVCLYGELCEAAEGVIRRLQTQGRPLPAFVPCR